MDFRILGPLEVSAGGRQISLGGPRRQKLIAALLLSAGQVVPLGHLVDAAWEHEPPATAAKQARNIVSDLRGRLAGTSATIVAAASGYRLDVSESDLDARVFARLVERARRDAENGRRAVSITGFRKALGLWRGWALEGFTGVALQPQLAYLNEERFVTFEQSIDLALAAGQHRSCLGELAEWVTANPLRERLTAQLMLALYRSERKADALAIYENTRLVLADRLGIDPGVKLQRLRQHILVDDHVLNWRPLAG